MEITNNIELKVVSFNCRGLSNSLEEIKTLCKTFDIILLQETWLAEQNRDFLNSQLYFEIYILSKKSRLRQ